MVFDFFAMLYLGHGAGVPWDYLRKFFALWLMDGYATKWRRNIAENFNPLSRVHERYTTDDDRQTDRHVRVKDNFCNNTNHNKCSSVHDVLVRYDLALSSANPVE